MLTNTERMRSFLAFVEAGQHETQPALELRAKLENALGADHPDLRRANLRIAQIKALAEPKSWRVFSNGQVVKGPVTAPDIKAAMDALDTRNMSNIQVVENGAWVWAA